MIFSLHEMLRDVQQLSTLAGVHVLSLNTCRIRVRCLVGLHALALSMWHGLRDVQPLSKQVALPNPNLSTHTEI